MHSVHCPRTILLVLTIQVSLSMDLVSGSYNQRGGVRKCCKLTEMLDSRTKTCVPHGGNLTSIVHYRFAEYKRTAGRNGTNTTTLSLFREEAFNLVDTYSPPCHDKNRLLFTSNTAAIYRTNVSGREVYKVTQEFGENFCLDTTDKRGNLVSIVMGCSKCVEGCISVCDPLQSRDSVNLTINEKTYKKVFVEQYCKKPIRRDAGNYEFDPVSGDLFVKGRSRHLSEYCINQTSENTLYLCKREDGVTDRLHTIILAFVSFVCLSILIIIHLIIRDFRKNLTTPLKIGIFWNLMFLYLTIFISNLKDFREKYAACVTFGILMQFFGLSTFCWMTSFSYDIWNMTRFIRPAAESTKKNSKYFLIFSVGFPVIVSVVTLTLQLSTEYTPNRFGDLSNRKSSGIFSDDHGTENYRKVIHPGIAVDSCFLGSNQAKLWYFHILVLVLLITNLFLFLASLYNLFFGTYMTENRNVRINITRKLVVLSQIFFLMGINWLAEFVIFMLEWTDTNVYWFSIILEIFNLLTGAMFLLQFLCVPTNREEIKNWIYEIKKKTTRHLFRINLSAPSAASSTDTALSNVLSRRNHDSGSSAGSGNGKSG